MMNELFEKLIRVPGGARSSASCWVLMIESNLMCGGLIVSCTQIHQAKPRSCETVPMSTHHGTGERAS